MRSRLNRLDLRRIALFVAVAATVAVVTVLVAREAGVDDAPATAAPNQQSVSTTQSDSVAAEAGALTLNLSAPDVCETLPAQEYSGAQWVRGEDGERRVERRSSGFARVNETPVEWKVTGGSAPYTLVIDGESRDAAGPYEGASGTASVSCAQSSSGAFF